MLLIDKDTLETERHDVHYFQEKAAMLGMTTTEYLLLAILDEFQSFQLKFHPKTPEWSE